MDVSNSNFTTCEINFIDLRKKISQNHNTIKFHRKIAQVTCQRYYVDPLILTKIKTTLIAYQVVLI